MKSRSILLAASLLALSFWPMLPARAQSSLQVQADLDARTELQAIQLDKHLREMNANAETLDALRFLYAYMPWPDVADYPLSYHVEQVAYAIRARQEMPWGRTVPEREWKHFVLPARINNETLDDFRATCYDELKQRVKGLSMREAVLEVNHWCHAYVTYKPSDARTSSPLATMRTATGRCGEESTFTVAALRAVGIPARQVYTPRWAHTDDNHAWVEAWVDGKWYFLGACEPEPVLNLGWFNQPASRGMLMHTKVFGRYDGPEDVMSRTDCYTEINVTSNYARTARTVVQVVDAKGKAVPGAMVSFKIYNYGELYTVRSVTADAKGRASIQTGLGSMVAWASQGDHYGFMAFHAGDDNHVVRIVMNHKPGETYAQDLTLTPPKGRNNLPAVSPAAAALNAKRFAQEDSLRTAYVRTFADSVRTDSLCRALHLDYQRVRPLVVKSCGNWRALFTLLSHYPTQRTLRLLEQLTDKDLRDFELDVIESHLQHLQPEVAGLTAEQQLFLDRYVDNPRVANEMLSAWRADLQSLKGELMPLLTKQPAQLTEWIDRRIKSNDSRNPLYYTLSPAAAYRLGYADLRNKGILFVALCRTFGVPARIDEVTERVQFVLPPSSASAVPTESTAAWQSVSFADEQLSAPNPSAHLVLQYEPRPHAKNPAYYTHFTLSAIRQGNLYLQNYPESATWQHTFRQPLAVEPADYLLTSGTRMADGTVLARLLAFPVKANQSVSEPLVMRADPQGVQVIGNFNAENRYFDPADGQVRSLLSKTGRGYYVTGLIRANHEPTNHILHDLEKMRAELEAWGRPILLLFPSADEYERFQRNRAEFTHLPATVSFGIDTQGSVAADLFGNGLVESKELPLVIIADTFNRVVFTSQGYTIGIGEQIKQTVSKL